MKLFGKNFNTGSLDAIASRKAKTQDKSLLTRFVGWLNNTFNADHDWMDYDSAPSSSSGAVDNWLKGVTQSGVTAQQAGLNEMQMQNQEDIYQRQVSGMQKAGLNPALMYGSGSSTAPSAPSGTSMASPIMSMSDIVQALTIPAQLKMMKAQTENIYAAAEQKRAQTETEGLRQESLRLANEYYPATQEANLDEVASRIGVNWSSSSRNQAEAALAWSKEFAQSKENQYADEYLHWRNELEKAKTQESIQSAANHMAQAAWIGYQNSFARSHGVLLSGGPFVAIGSMLSTALSRVLGIRENGDDSSLPSVEDVLTGAFESLKRGLPDNPSKPRHRLKTQRELDAEDRWKRKSGWQKFRSIMENLD